MTLRHVRYSIDPRLATILAELDGSPYGPALSDRLIDLLDRAAPVTRTDERAAALRAHRWWIDRAADGGIPLTSAGYLKPEVLKEFAAVVPTMDDWIFPISREVNVQPVLEFRRHLQRMGVLRKRKDRLLLTPAGRAASQDADALWDHLAERLVPSTSAFEETAGIIVMLHMATAVGNHLDVDAIARTLMALGWKHDGGKPLTRADVYFVANDFWAAIGNVGTRRSNGVLDRTPSPEALAMVRDALLTEADGVG